MSRRPLLSRVLFWLTCGVAAGLVLLVVVASLTEGRWSEEERILYLFAHDATLRRTSLASALGLIVTAFVFFQGPSERERPLRRRPPRSSGAGA